MTGGPSRGDSVDAAELDTDLELVGIVAVAENGVIGSDGDIPWHEPADLAHFKETTMDHPVIVGRTTYESILEGLGEPLPGRTMVVLTTRSLEPTEGVVTAAGVAPAIVAARRVARCDHGGADRAYVAGGASVYEQFLPFLDRLVVTEVPGRPEGDTRFPDWDRSLWRTVTSHESEGLTFLEFDRR